MPAIDGKTLYHGEEVWITADSSDSTLCGYHCPQIKTLTIDSTHLYCKCFASSSKRYGVQMVLFWAVGFKGVWTEASCVNCSQVTF